MTVPELSSNPGAPVSVYLDFDGENLANQDYYINNSTFLKISTPLPSFTLDNNLGPDSPAEERMIEEIFERVAEDFRPFTVNVTTVLPAPGSLQIHVVVGGSGQVFTTTGGAASSYLFTRPVFGLRGGYSGTGQQLINPVLVFPQQLPSISGVEVARLVSRGVGYRLGLEDLRSTGTIDSGAIMGTPNLNPTRDTWSVGTSVTNASQDDIAIMVGNGAFTNPGFRLRSDDVGDTIAQASGAENVLSASASTQVVQLATNGIIDSSPISGRIDRDVYSLALDFRSTNGIAQLSVSAAGLDLSQKPFLDGTVNGLLNPGTNLDLVAELYDSSGTLLVTSDLTTGLSADIAYEVPATSIPSNRIATFYLVVTSTSEQGSLGAYSVVGSLQEVLGSPLILTPAGAVTSATPSFSWTESLQATSYQLQVEAVATGATLIDVLTTNPNYLAVSSLGQGSFRARVRAIRGFGGLNNESVWSEYSQFTIDVPTPAKPRLTRPQGEIGDSFPSFEWGRNEHDASYSLWVNNKAGTRVLLSTGISGITYTHFNPLPDGEYTAWVRAFNSVSEHSSWSDPVTFSLKAPLPTKGIITGPSAKTAEIRPRIVWNAIEGVARYDLWIDNLSTRTSQYIRQQNLPRTQAFYDPTIELTQGEYLAWVRGVNGNGVAGAWSAAYKFEVNVLPPDVPTVTGPVPATGSSLVTTVTPTFTWRPVARATTYDLWVNNITTNQAQIIRRTNVTTTSFTPTTGLPQGNYRAWVRGINAAGEPGLWSPAFSFTIDEPTPSIPSITAPVPNPAGSVETDTPTIRWSTTVAAPFYELEIDNATLNQAKVISVTGLREMLYTIPTSQRFGEYTYIARVRARNSSGDVSAWSPNYTIRVDIPNPSTPVIVGPTDTSNNRNPRFLWTHSAGNVRYEILVRDLVRNESKVLLVTNLQLAPGGANAFYTVPTTSPLAPSTYRFWVRAFNSQGQASSWSTSQTFVISTVGLDSNSIKLQGLMDEVDEVLLTSLDQELVQQPDVSHKESVVVPDSAPVEQSPGVQRRSQWEMPSEGSAVESFVEGIEDMELIDSAMSLLSDPRNRALGES